MSYHFTWLTRMKTTILPTKSNFGLYTAIYNVYLQNITELYLYLYKYACICGFKLTILVTADS